MFIGMVLEMFGIGLILPTITVLLDTDSIRDFLQLEAYSDFQIIAFFLSLLMLVFFIKTVYLLFLAWRQSSFSFRIGAEIAEKLFSIYLAQPYLFHTKKNTSELIRNITLEVNMFTQVLTAILIIMSEILILIGIVSIVVYIEPKAAVPVILLLLLFGFLVERLLKKKITGWGAIRQNNEFERLKAIQQGFGGIKATKILGKEEEFEDRFSLPNKLIAGIAIKVQTVQAFPRLWFEFLAVTTLSLIIIVYVYLGTASEGILPLVAVFAAAAFRLLPSANRLLSSFQSLRFNKVVIKNLTEELSLISSIETKEKILQLPPFKELRLNNISFRFPGSPEDIFIKQSMSIKKGERIGVIGESGSGKTTLMNILLGLIAPTSGSLTIDGKDMMSCRRSWQRKLGYVPQDVFLDDDTLLRNIAFGIKESDIDEQKVEECVDQAQLRGFVNTLDLGLNTVVGERGAKISGGQKQRIGLARALYHSPKFLILDEATSALDTDTELEVMKAVYSLSKELTIIIVAHRISTLEEVDKLIKVDKGSLVEVK